MVLSRIRMGGHIRLDMGSKTFVLMIQLVRGHLHRTHLPDCSVYCSHKRNNVNIIFEHPLSNVHFELTRIVVKVRQKQKILFS